MPQAVSKDVQDELLASRRRSRGKGQVPYPVEFSPTQLAYDNWNQMFLTSLCRNITMHQFETPPSKVLDLGCGCGFWILEASKKWPACHFVGLDTRMHQPDFARMGRMDPQLKEYANYGRIQWLHGNLLDSLPFGVEEFDLVRICCIGLGVPEDEWQDLFQEVSRVLKPGGVLEIIEDDLIFPCGKSSASDYNTLQVTTPSFQASYSNSITSPSLTSIASSLHSPTSHRFPTLSHAPSTDFSVIRQSTRSQFQSPSRVDVDTLLNPHDHNKLRDAWEKMLQTRFLASRLVPVLQFYLSSEFSDIQTHPTYNVPLLPNSYSEDSGKTHSQQPLTSETFDLDSGFHIDLRKQSVQISEDSQQIYNEKSTASKMPTKSTYNPAWASMHLARTVNLIQGCKEAIWHEYYLLSRPNTKPIRSGIEDEAEYLNVKSEFDMAWSNWENDMKDRIGMRDQLQRSLSWSIPPEDERPDWRVWRDRVGTLDTDLVTDQDTDSNKSKEYCRSLRGFVAYKSRTSLWS
ncbi:hypothetical protein ABKN59_002545 [Abortiporus biennis]